MPKLIYFEVSSPNQDNRVINTGWVVFLMTSKLIVMCEIGCPFKPPLDYIELYLFTVADAPVSQLEAKLHLISHRVFDSWWLFLSSCSSPRRGHFSQSVLPQLSWQPLQPSDSLCPWWGPSFTAGGASWLTAASPMPLATPASPTSVLLTPRASMWVSARQTLTSRNEVWSFSAAAGSLNSWPLSLPHNHNRGAAAHHGGFVPFVCVCVCVHGVWEKEGLWGWVSVFSVTQSVTHCSWWQKCWPDPVGLLQALSCSTVL